MLIKKDLESGTKSDMVLDILMQEFIHISGDISSFTVVENLNYDTSVDKLRFEFFIELSLHDESVRNVIDYIVSNKCIKLAKEHNLNDIFVSSDSNFFVSNAEVSTYMNSHKSLSYEPIHSSDISLSVSRYVSNDNLTKAQHLQKAQFNIQWGIDSSNQDFEDLINDI